MGNTSLLPLTTLTQKDKVFWEYQRNGTWEKFDSNISKIIESNFLLGKKNILFHGNDMIDFALMEERKGEKVRPIRRRVMWNMEKEDTVEVSSIKTYIPNPSTNPEEEPQDLLEFMLTLSTQRDAFDKENKNLKSQIEEMVASLKEIIETRDRALLTQKETLETLRGVTEEAERAGSQVKTLSGRLQVKEMENRELSMLNSELRVKLSSELQELGKTLEPKVEETEKLKNELKSLQNDLVGKEREIEVLKSNTTTPISSPRQSVKYHSARLKSPLRPETNLMPSNNQLPSLKLKTPTSTLSTSAPGVNTKLESSSEVTPRNRSSRTSGAYSARQSRDGTETPKRRPSISPRFNEIGTKISGVDPSSEIKKCMNMVEELKEKLIQSENSCRSLEGLLDVEKFKYANMKKEMAGKEKEIELLRKQKDAVKDELNDFIHRNSELTLTLETQTTKIHKLQSKLKKLHPQDPDGNDSGDSENSENSENSGDSSSEDSVTAISEGIKTAEDLEELTRRYEERESKYRTLKETYKRLQESLSSLVERSAEVDSLKSALERVTGDLREKEKEILVLRSSSKEPINAKIFKALAEEAQNEKTKALTLTNKVKQLTKEIQEKDKEIQSLKLLLTEKNSQQQQEIMSDNSIKEEKEVENGKSILVVLTNEIDVDGVEEGQSGPPTLL